MIHFLASASSAIQDAANQTCTGNCQGPLLPALFSQLSNLLIFMVGAVSVIMMIVGGLRYVLSNGDSKAAGEAKNTIMYSVIGIVIAIAAYGIVQFVSSSFK